jgi:predicted Mrr-cat superfamily restriction endonuclease
MTTLLSRFASSDDLSTTTPDALKGRASTRAQQIYARQLIKFAYDMSEGDLVIVPRLTATHRDYLLACITGPYRHHPRPISEVGKTSGNHQRPVEWLGCFARDSLSPIAARSLNGRSTMFRPSAGQTDLRRRLTTIHAIDG